MLKKPRAREYFSIKYCFAGEEEKIPHVLDSYVKNQLDLSDINRVLELSSIKQFFDKYDHVNGWSDDCYLKNKELSRNVEKEVKSFFLSISENKIVSIYDACEVMFRDEFWKYFYIYKVYEKISMEHFKEIAEGLHMSPNKLLENKNLVEKFDVQITEMLKTPEFGAGFIVDFYLRKDNGKTKYYLPKGLTREDKYNTVKAYINGDIVNANILDLIMNGKSKNPKEFEVDVKLKYLAKKRYERYWDENTMPVIKHETGINVSFSPENPDCEVGFSAGVITAKYNSNWIKDNLDYPTLLNNFIYLFAYTDGYMRCSLTAESLKQGIIENLFSTQGNGMYQKGQSFELLNALSNVQMHGYVGVLNSCDIYLEDIIKWFFEVYIKNEFGANGFICNMPEKSDSILSKYERVATVMDGETKQFKLFCEEGEIDRELYEMISGSVRYKEIPSLIKNKYAYANSNEIVREMHDMFSDQCMLSYTEKTGSKYNTFFELLRLENVKPEEIEEYNFDELNWLLERGVVYVSDGMLALNYERIWILKELNDNNNVKISDKLINNLGRCSLDVEMETGTGKTYVYIKTMYELNKYYGWSKFIVVVPSIAIREGVKKSFEITQDHFMEQYGKKVRFFVYNSSNLNQLDAFSSNSGINVMIINMQAFNTSMKEGGKSKEARIIYDKRDEFGSRRPIDVIKANNPIIILDEPQKMGGDATQKALQNFNPLFCLNYSATHKEHHNLVYALDAVDAYNQRLVKRIEVMDEDEFVQCIKGIVPNPAVQIEIETDKRSESYSSDYFDDLDLSPLLDYSWNNTKNIRKIDIDLTCEEYGFKGRGCIGILIKNDMPVEEIEILSKDVEIDGEIYTLSSSVKYKNNCITETSTSISVDEDGEIDTNTSWSERFKSKSSLSIHGIEVPYNLFPNYSNKMSKAVLNILFPFSFRLDIGVNSDLNLNSARDQIIYDEKWLTFEENLYQVICKRLKEQLSLSDWERLNEIIQKNGKNIFSRVANNIE